MERGGEALPVVFKGAMFPCSDFTNSPPLFAMQVRNKLNELHTDQGQTHPLSPAFVPSCRPRPPSGHKAAH